MAGGRPYAGAQSQISRAERQAVNAAAVQEPGWWVDAFVYSSTIRTIGASATDRFSIPIEPDAEFIAEWISGILIDDAGGGVMTPAAVDGAFNAAATVQITDTGSGRTMFSEPTYWHNVVGTAQTPCYLASPKQFSPNGSILIEVVEILANASIWQLSIGGFKRVKRAG